MTSPDLAGPAREDRKADLRLAAAMGAGVYALCMLLAPQLLNDADSHWHLFIGEHILANGRLPVSDAFSHTMAGQPWIAKEWLSQVLMAAAFRAGGWTGLAVLAAAAAGLAFALLSAELSRRLDWRVTLMLAGAALVLSLGHLLARPHLLAMPLMVIWAAGLLRAAEAGRVPSFWLLPVMALWANLHGSFMLGLALGGPAVLEALVRADAAQRLRLVLGWALFGALALAAACIHPHGPQSILAAFRVLGLGEAQGIIVEWRAHDFSRLSGLEIVLLGGLGLALATGFRMPLVRLALLVVLIHMALAHIRHQSVLGLVGALLLAPAIAARRPGEPASAPGPVLPVLAGALSLVVVATLTTGLAGTARPNEANMPRAALAAARAAGVSGNVLNGYGFGGWLITQGVPTFVDGRTELFGGPFVARFMRAIDLADADDFVALLEQHRIGWTLLPAGTPAIAVLDRLPGWQRLHADAIAVVHRRLP